MPRAATGPVLGLAVASFLTMGAALLVPRASERGAPDAPPVSPVITTTTSSPSGIRVAPDGAGFELFTPTSLRPQVHRLKLRRVVQIRRGRRAVLELDSAPLLPWIRATDLPAGQAPWRPGGQVNVPALGLRFDFGGEAWVWLERPRVLLLVGAGRLVQVKADWQRPAVVRALRTYRAVTGAGLRDLSGGVIDDARAQVEALLTRMPSAQVKALPRALALGLERLPDLDALNASILLRHLTARARVAGLDPSAESVRQACARCHRFPPPSILPRDRWPKRIGEMTQMPLPMGVKPLSTAEVRAAIAYYTARAPSALPVRPPSPLSAGRFTARGERPPQLLGTPSASHVSLGEGVISVLDTRTSSLFRLDRNQAGWRKIAGGLSTPARLAPYGSDGGLLIAGLGTVDPTDRRVGRVSLLPPGTPHCRSLAHDLGRTSDAQPGDFDQDGDLDVVAAAFGFRTPGGLELLIRDGARFTRRTLDPRDGFVRAVPVDLDKDGQLDVIALLTQEHEQVVWFKNEGGLRFTPRILHRAPHPGWGYAALEVLDLDGDGDVDLLLANGDSLDTRDLLRADHGVSWLENRGEAQFTHRRIGLLYGATSAVAGDVDGDGDLDVVASSFLPLVPTQVVSKRRLDSVVWFERRGPDWIRHTVEQGRCVHPTIAIGDVSGDGKPDLVVGEFHWRSRPSGDARPLVTVFRQR